MVEGRSAAAGSDLTSRSASCGAMKTRAARQPGAPHPLCVGLGRGQSRQQRRADGGGCGPGVVVEEHNIQVHISALRWGHTLALTSKRIASELGSRRRLLSSPARSRPPAT